MEKEKEINLPGAASGGRARFWAPTLVLALVVLAIYGQSIRFGYVNYDDVLITGKDWIEYRELSRDNLLKLFTPGSGGAFQPLRHLAFGLVYRVSGTDPWGYHLFNVLLYYFNLIVVFFLFRKLLTLSPLLRRNGRSAQFWAWGGTVWFAVHPIHVEPVAFMVSNKDLLSGVFYFTSLLFYLKSREQRLPAAYYLGAVFFFLLGLLSKPSVAALPLVVVAVELFYPQAEFNWKKIALRTLPFLAVAAAAALYYVFRTTTFTGYLLQNSLSVHFFTMASVLAKYLKVLFLPVNLCHSYPPPFFSGEYNYRLALYLAADAALFFLLIWSALNKKRDLAFGVSFFLLNLLPVSGILPISIFMADRYLYISSFGFVFAVIAILIVFFRQLENQARSRRLFALLALGGLIFLGLLSFDRCRAWKDGVTLWGEAVRVYPNFQFNHYGLGNSLLKAGRPKEALASYERVNLFKDNIKATFNMARIYDEMGDSLTAATYYRKVVDLYIEDLDEPEIMSVTYKRLGMKEELAGLLEKWAVSLRGYPGEVLSIARNLWRMGHSERAVGVVEGAVDGAPPPVAGLRTALAGFQALAGDLESAMSTVRDARSTGESSVELDILEADLEFARGNRQRAAELYAGVPEGFLSGQQRERMAASYFDIGRLAEALEIFRALAASAPGPQAAAINNVGVVLEAMDSLEASENKYLRAVELNPDYADAWYNLGNVARKQGKANQALEYYSHARKLEGVSEDVETSRASLLVELGRYREAFQTYNNLIELDSTNVSALLGAGDVLWKEGRKSLAKKYYLRYLDRTGFENAPSRVRERLQP